MQYFWPLILILCIHIDNRSLHISEHNSQYPLQMNNTLYFLESNLVYRENVSSLFHHCTATIAHFILSWNSSQRGFSHNMCCVATHLVILLTQDDWHWYLVDRCFAMLQRVNHIFNKSNIKTRNLSYNSVYSTNPKIGLQTIFIVFSRGFTQCYQCLKQCYRPCPSLPLCARVCWRSLSFLFSHLFEDRKFWELMNASTSANEEQWYNWLKTVS